MNYERIDMGAYNLHLIKTKRFKTITVEVNFRERVIKENITKRNLLKSVIINTSKKFQSERSLIIESENLYDLKLLSSNMRIGNYSNLSFKIRFLNEKYTDDCMNRYSISFLLDLLFNPDIVDNGFRSDVVLSCKNKLGKSIKSIRDNKLRYALLNLLSSVYDKPYSYNSYGYLDDLEKIDEKNLYEYYMKILNDNFVDVFVVGDIDIDVIKNIFKEEFKINTFKKVSNDILVDELKSRKRVIRLNDNDVANQTQLTILCSMNRLTEFERKYVSLVYSELLGGSSNSLLFDTVREKNSYAYYINSNCKPYDNCLLIYSGIEPGNSEQVLKLIKKTLLDINKGNFDTGLLDSAKETIISSIKSSKDSPAGIINTYYAMELVNSKSFDERIDNISRVNLEDIINLSKKITMHTVYILEGEQNERD